MADIKYTFSELISEDQTKKIQVIKLEGQLDESNIDNFAPIVSKKIEEHPGENFILDVENISYMNSKSIGYMSQWFGLISSGGAKLIIAKPATNIRDILNVVGLDQVIPIAQTTEEAKSLI